jgi:hypothetical protein
LLYKAEDTVNLLRHKASATTSNGSRPVMAEHLARAACD